MNPEQEDRGFAGLLGIRLLEATPHLARVELDCGERHHNIFEKLHGGVAYSLVEEAARHLLAAAGREGRVRQVNINYLAPAQAGQEVVAEARPAEDRGEGMLVAVELKDGEQGRLLVSALVLAEDA